MKKYLEQWRGEATPKAVEFSWPLATCSAVPTCLLNESILIIIFLCRRFSYPSEANCGGSFPITTNNFFSTTALTTTQWTLPLRLSTSWKPFFHIPQGLPEFTARTDHVVSQQHVIIVNYNKSVLIRLPFDSWTILQRWGISLMRRRICATVILSHSRCISALKALTVDHFLPRNRFFMIIQ